MNYFEPSREAALQALEAFVPSAGTYAQTRNFAFDLGDEQTTSVLSPYLRTRLLSEEEVTRAVIAEHGINAPQKFLQEVAWRTYWRGWLEMRPSVWTRICCSSESIGVWKRCCSCHRWAYGN